MWGWTDLDRWLRLQGLVFPTHVGVDRQPLLQG